MQKNILLVIIFALFSATLSACFLNLKINSSETLADVILAFNEHLPSGERLSLRRINSFSEASELSAFFAKKLKKCPTALKQHASNVVEQINKALRTTPSLSPQKTRRGGKKSCGSPSRLEAIEELNLSVWIDLRLTSLFYHSECLTYGNLVVWLEKKCAIIIDTDLFDNLEGLLESLKEALEAFLASEHSTKMNFADLETTQTIYTFLKSQDKYLDMYGLGQVQAQVDKILTFVKLSDELPFSAAVTAV